MNTSRGVNGFIRSYVNAVYQALGSVRVGEQIGEELFWNHVYPIVLSDTGLSPDSLGRLSVPINQVLFSGNNPYFSAGHSKQRPDAPVLTVKRKIDPSDLTRELLEDSVCSSLLEAKFNMLNLLG